MIEAIQPNFDTKDGAFWMSYEEFFQYFCSITICKVQNWHELRMKGKFICVEEEGGYENDWVISQFFYTFHLKKAGHVEIGLHQEDDRTLGADRRPYIDMSYIILKKNSDNSFTYICMADLQVARDVEDSFNLEAGQYVVVPYSTGALLRKSTKPFDEVEIKVDVNGKEKFNKFVDSAFNDIFRKIDLQLDGVLTARELNAFGKIIGDPFYEELTQESFQGPDFQNISHVAEGITRHGFFQLMHSYSKEKIVDILTAMGYDETLQSTKSRVIVITFHSTEPIKVKVGNASKCDINEKAVNLMMADHLEKSGAKQAREDKNAVVFRKYHAKAYANTFAALNKTPSEIEVNIDFSSSQNCVFKPIRGKCSDVLPGRALKYIGATIVDPSATSFTSGYKFTTRKLNNKTDYEI